MAKRVMIAIDSWEMIKLGDLMMRRTGLDSLGRFME